MASAYHFQTSAGEWVIRLQRDGSIEASGPHGPIVFTTWTLEGAFVDEFSDSGISEDELKRVYRDFAGQHQSRASDSAPLSEQQRAWKRAYRSLFQEVSAILYKHDPAIGLPELPDDEYDPEAGTILPRLQDATGIDDVEGIVGEELDRWFGPLPQPPGSLRPIAEEIWKAWQRLGPL